MNNAQLERAINAYIHKYVSQNRAALIAKSLLDAAGTGLKPLVDHITFRTRDIDRRAQEFVRLGYVYAETLEYRDWYAKVYRLPRDFRPCLSIKPTMMNGARVASSRIG